MVVKEAIYYVMAINPNSIEHNYQRRGVRTCSVF